MAIELNSYPSLLNDANLVSYWRLEGNSNDSKGSNNGTDTNITYGASYGKFGQGASLNGSSSKIVIMSNIGIAFGGITLGGWFNLAAQPSSGSSVTIVKHGSGAPYNIVYDVSYVNTGGTYSVAINRTKSGVGVETASANLAGSLSGYNLLIGTFDGSNINIYLNGTLLDSTAISGYGTSAEINEVSLGCADFNGTTYNRINGSIDDAFIFSRALTETEILNYYNAVLGSGFFNFF